MANEIKDGGVLAKHFMALSPDEFNKFWMTVCFEWNIEDSEMDAQWFYCGKKLKPSALTVISAMHSAVASGKKSAASEGGDA